MDEGKEKWILISLSVEKNHFKLNLISNADYNAFKIEIIFKYPVVEVIQQVVRHIY